MTTQQSKYVFCFACGKKVKPQPDNTYTSSGAQCPESGRKVKP